MFPMTVADLRNALADLPGDHLLVDVASGLSLVDAEAGSSGVELLFLDTMPRPRRRAAVNTVSGNVHGALMQVGGDHHGDIRL